MADRLDLDAIRRNWSRSSDGYLVLALCGEVERLRAENDHLLAIAQTVDTVTDELAVMQGEVVRLQAVADAARQLRDDVTNVQPLSAIAPLFRALDALDGD